MNAVGLRSFGELLREFRVAAGLTQEALAERARMSRAAINKLERGARQRPYRATIALLADALSLSVSDRLELEQAAHRGALVTPQDVKLALNLPIHFSTFVGRDRDVTKVCDMLATHRLVTLVGAGGVGKTRLAVHAAEHFIAANATGNQYDGVWFVDLSVVIDREMTMAAIGSSVGMEQCRTLDKLVGYLRAQRFLLIVDNCEHLLDEVAQLAGELLRHCPNGKILATSRQPLGVDGERIYRVQTLSVPIVDADAKLSVSKALEFSAIRLFADRAEAAGSGFELTESIIPAVTEICRRLDGIALAIELAAARTSAFSAAAIAQRLDEHFLLVTAGMHGSLSRHKTMRAVFDWSYGLLEETERQVFRRLSTFVGGFTLELATSLWTGEIAESVIIGVIASLVDKSLVQCDSTAETPRYKMLEPARQYAREKLREHEEENVAARAHAKALLALAEGFDSSLELRSNRVLDAYVEPERDNFRAAFEWSLGRDGDAELGQRLAGSKTAARCGFASGEVRKWTSAALERCSATTPPEVQAKLALTTARSAINFEVSPEVALAVSRRAANLQQPDDLPAVADAQYLVGVAFCRMEQLNEAAAALREARVIARRCGAHRDYFFATEALASVCYSVGDLDQARKLIEEALRQTRAAGAEWEQANATITLAEIEFASGCVERAVTAIKDAAAFFRTHGILPRLTMALSNLSAYFVVLNRYEEARYHAREALRYARIPGVTLELVWLIQHLAAVVLFSDGPNERDTRFRRVARLLGFVNENAARTGRWRMHTEQQEYDRMISALHEVFEEDELTTLMDGGKAWSEDQAIAEALAT